MHQLKFLTIVLAASLFFISCGHDTDVVDSGTYDATVDKVKAGEKEIYAKTDDNKTLELYFTDSTKLTRGGSEVEFSELQKGQKVELKVEKVGKRLNPIAVTIKE